MQRSEFQRCKGNSDDSLVKEVSNTYLATKFGFASFFQPFFSPFLFSRFEGDLLGYLQFLKIDLVSTPRHAENESPTFCRQVITSIQ